MNATHDRFLIFFTRLARWIADGPPIQQFTAITCRNELTAMQRLTLMVTQPVPISDPVRMYPRLASCILIVVSSCEHPSHTLNCMLANASDRLVCQFFKRR
ncbi:MAG: hypothetical protein L7W43_05785 [Rubripirellula sp.]|nr:hypothetical protein [Rubripirellula sp.]